MANKTLVRVRNGVRAWITIYILHTENMEFCQKTSLVYVFLGNICELTLTKKVNINIKYQSKSICCRYRLETWSTSLFYLVVRVYADLCTVKTMNFWYKKQSSNSVASPKHSTVTQMTKEQFSPVSTFSETVPSTLSPILHPSQLAKIAAIAKPLMCPLTCVR